jgi:hypothetical protein
MKTLQHTSTHYLSIIIFFCLTASLCLPGKSQNITQPAQIAWGRYFEDTAPGSHFDKEDIGDRIYYHDNNLFFVGRTKGDSLYPTAPDKTSPNFDGDAFIASYNPVCHTYNWIRYLGGPTAEEYAYCAAFDHVGDNSWVYIAGEVNEGSGPKSDMLKAQSYVTSGCTTVFQPKAASKLDAFIAKYNAITGELVRWTYIGGAGFEQILSLAVDSITHNVYFAGYTESPAFLTYSNYGFNPYKGNLTGEGKMFFGGFDSCLNTLKYFSYYGGNGCDRAHDLEILYANNTRYLVMSGTSQSQSGIVPPNSVCFDSTYGAGQKDNKNPDAFLVIWNVNTLSSPPDWCSYWGGSLIDRGRGIALTSNNEIYLTGQTLSLPDTGSSQTFIPSPDAYMPTTKGRYDSYVAKFKIDSFNAPMGVRLTMFTYIGGNQDDFAKSVLPFHTNSSSNGTDTFVVAGLTYSPDLPPTDSNAHFLSKQINGNGKHTKRDVFFAVITKDPANPTAKQKLSSFAYLGGENDETDIKQDSTLVQKSYNPGLALGPNGSVFIIYTSRGGKSKLNGNIPVEYGAYHNVVDSGAKPQPDVYFAQVYPFTQHFVPPVCTIETKEEQEPGSNILSDISFYPVPFSSITTINIFTNQQNQATISIYDLFGRMIMEKKVSLHTGDNKMPFDFSSYPSGIYISKVIMNSMVYENKITKQQ